MARKILLDGRHLTRRDFSAVVRENCPVGLSPQARKQMQKSRSWVETIIAEKQVVYGVTTGVGSLSTEHIEPLTPHASCS
jgi:histidine ammonia-lyase